MKFGSVCSGIGAPEAAWIPLGMECVFMSEIEKFPRAVLAHRHPEVPCHGDFTTIQKDDYDDIDILVGGTPCQGFSIAGLRKGLDDDRSNLALQYVKLLDRLKPRWFVFENVPGCLSTNGGRDFGSILGGVAEVGYGYAYRVLDAQFFGVPQRRRRVFLVGYLGDWRPAAAVLFEPESMRGDSPPSRKTRKDVAPTISARTKGGGGLGTDFDLDGGLIQTVSTIDASFARLQGASGQDLNNNHDHLIAFGGNNNNSGPIDVATACNAHGGPMGRMDFESETFIAQPIAIQERAICENPDSGPDGVGVRTDGVAYTLEARTVPPQAVVFSCKDYGADAGEIAPTLRAMGCNGSHANAGGQLAIAFPSRLSATQYASTEDLCPALAVLNPTAVAYDMRGREGGAQMEGPHDTANIRAAAGGSSRSYVQTHAVRRLTPTECERLQGFPDDFTLIPWRKSVSPDGNRYKALGNSMAVPVMKWIGQRILAADELLQWL